MEVVVMGIGVQALALMKYMSDDGYLRGMSSAMELGSQQFAPDLDAARTALKMLFPSVNSDVISRPKDFYFALGFNTYRCIDLDGANDALVFNLNKSLSEEYNFNEMFDLVTNHGTTEHAFDQYMCFENVHKLTKRDGIMIHALPSQGYQNHSFFNYHPSFFMDLSSANNYQILGLYYNIGESLFPYDDSFLETHDVSATEFVAVFAILRKLSDSPFVVPFDGRYYFDQHGEEFVPRNDVGGHTRVQVNDFPLSAKHFTAGEAQSRGPGTKIVVPVWGKQFVDNFMNFAVRSQIESGLLTFRPRDEVEYVIVTDSAGDAMLRRSKFFPLLRELTRIKIIKADHLAHLSAYNRLTESYNLSLAHSQPNDLYIFITSDCFFSREVFARIWEKSQTARVIFSPALRVVEETFVSDVALSNAYSVDGRQALALAMRNEHPLTEAFCLNNDRSSMHPLPAQCLYRLKDGYVGRWSVMHPIAVRIVDPAREIRQTIDWNYPIHHIKSWSDVAVLDSIDDGLVVSLTPFEYNQGEEIRRSDNRAIYLRNLTRWANNPWELNFHAAQISCPVRLLLGDGGESSEVLQAEKQIGAFIDKFLAYVNTRKWAPCADFRALAAVDLFRRAIDTQDFTERWRLFAGVATKAAKRRIKPRVRRLVGT
jgi:hypothetical protein